MKRIIGLFIVTAVIAVMISACSGNRRQNAGTDSTQESAADTTQDILLPSVIDLFQFNDDYNSPFMIDYRIWGWSRDGRVAYSATGHDGGITSLYFNIVDYFSEDSRSVNYWENFDDFNVDDDGNHLDADGRIINFNEIYRDFYNICYENGIEFIQSEYRPLPIVRNNRTHNVIVDLTKQYMDGIEAVERYSVIADVQGERFVYSAEEGYAYDVFLLGYFLNPFGNKALLVTGKSIFGGYITEYFIGLDLDTGFPFADAAVFQSEEQMPVISIDNAPDDITGDYHFFADYQVNERIILYAEENLENFAYIEILHSIDPDDNFAFLVGEVLFGLDEFTPEKPFVVTAYIGSTIPTRGIFFGHGESVRYFYITESGMDGSLQLIEFTPFFD